MGKLRPTQLPNYQNYQNAHKVKNANLIAPPSLMTFSGSKSEFRKFHQISKKKKKKKIHSNPKLLFSSNLKLQFSQQPNTPQKIEVESILPDSTSHQKISTLLSPFYTKTLLTVIHTPVCVKDLGDLLLVSGDQLVHVDPHAGVLPNRLDDAPRLPDHPSSLQVVAQNSKRRCCGQRRVWLGLRGSTRPDPPLWRW